MALDEETRRVIAGALAEIDMEQVRVMRRFSAAHRVEQALSMIALSEEVAAYRLRLRRPELSEAEALRLVRSRA